MFFEKNACAHKSVRSEKACALKRVRSKTRALGKACVQKSVRSEKCALRKASKKLVKLKGVPFSLAEM